MSIEFGSSLCFALHSGDNATINLSVMATLTYRHSIERPLAAMLRRSWFDWYREQLARNSVVLDAKDGPYPCPCCRFRTLTARGEFELCPVCSWEDDGQDDHDAGRVRGGPNGSLSLTEARNNFRQFGACSLEHIDSVRDPFPEELAA